MLARRDLKQVLRRSRGRRTGWRLTRVLAALPHRWRGWVKLGLKLGLRFLLPTAFMYLETAESPFSAGPAQLAGQMPGHLKR